MQLVACQRCRTQFDISRIAPGELRCPCGAIVDQSAHAPVDAPIQRCGSCGAAVVPDATACDYCRSPIIREPAQLTLLCPECYARNAGSARFCTHCGIEFRPQPLPTTTEQTLSCPACQVAMANQTIGGVVVGECPQCNGLWVPGESFNDLIERARTAAAARPPDATTGLGVVKSPRPLRQSRRHAASGVVYRRCPVCKSPMHRKNFGNASGVIVDWCGPHGTWLDADELGEIGEFVLSGRFAAATAKAAKAAAEEAERARAQALSAIARHAPAPDPALAVDRTLIEHLIWGRRKSGFGRSGLSLGDILRDLLRS